jgi:hypothetical protein
MSSLKRHEGWLMSDNRCSHQGVMESATITCAHCATAYIKNPDRTRPRNYCRKCDNYICDGCGAVAASADYEHRSFKQLSDMVRSGRFTIVGGTMSAPLLIKGDQNG